jgi:hypothetical protein
VCFPALAKTAYPYYLLEPWVFCSVWWLARPGRVLNWRITAPALLLIDLFVLKWVVSLPFDAAGGVAGVASTLTLLGAGAIIFSDLLRWRPDTLAPNGGCLLLKRGHRVAGVNA